jgi:hypothetical protein
MLKQSTKINCIYCDRLIFPHSVTRHFKACHLHPTNKKLCVICSKPIKYWKDSKGTCSHSCANKHFRTGELHGNWKPEQYRTTCFSAHKKECVVCGENKIVAVHHLNEDHSDNRIENLIPLCPTHHQYWHSKYRPLIEGAVSLYIKEWKKKNLISV